jgi:diguanylate cyclase (GGDEF)-like protein
MRQSKLSEVRPLPQTRHELDEFVREYLRLPLHLENSLKSAIDAVFTRHERLWQESKQEAIQALSAGFADKMAGVKRELNARDATVSSISKYFEQLVADLTDKSHRDPKTKLMNFGRFTEQLESFLALEQRGRWCGIGLVDITSFKWYNDSLGHATGDRIIKRVAHLLREQVRTDDLLAQERPVEETESVDELLARVSARREPGGGGHETGAHETGTVPQAPESKDLHARFGGDEFCFLIPDLAEYHQAYAIAERFREAVERYDWTTEDQRLSAQPVHVDVGVVCLWLGPIAERRFIARRLAAGLLKRADELMYEAKGERASHIYLVRARIENGELREVDDDDSPSGNRHDDHH